MRIVPPEGLSLRSGMSVRADIFLGDGQRRLAVPVEAISTETGDDGKPVRHVWLAKDGKATRATVQTGASDDRWEVVTKGIAQGDTVIVGPAKALRGLSEGAQVKRRDPAKSKDEGDGKGADDDAKDAG